MNELQELKLEETLWQSFVNGLPEPSQDLWQDLGAVDRGCALLHFLHTHSRTFLTADDIAYNLNEPLDAVKEALGALEELGLVTHVVAEGLALYAITSTPEKRQALDELFEWQERWHAALACIGRAIVGESLNRGLAPLG